MADRRDIYLTIAREGINRGKVAMTRFAAGNAMRLSEGNNVEKARAEVYQGAALVVSADFEQGLSILGVCRQAISGRAGQGPAQRGDVGGGGCATRAGRSIGPAAGKTRSLLRKFKAVALARTAMAQVDKLLNEADR